MEQKIKWYSGCFDEIELVYEKAEDNDAIAVALSEIETMALHEAEENCGLLRIGDAPLTREKYIAMNEHDKEVVISYLSGVGLQEFIPSREESKITITFTPYIQKVLGCTMFSILNRLEKLDGAFDVFCPNTTLELRVPLGAKAGMFKCEMLIMQLYPWLSVKEISTNAVSSTMNDVQSTNNSANSKCSETQTTEKKKGLFAKLFGK